MKKLIASVLIALASLCSNASVASQSFVEIRGEAKDLSPEALYSFGIIYLEGKGVAKDYKMAAEYFTKAVESDYAKAQYELAKLYIEAKGLAKDEAKGLILMEKSAKSYPKAEQFLKDNYPQTL